MTFGARWDDDEAKIVFKMYQVSAGGSYDVRVGIGTGASSPLSMLHVCALAGGNYTGTFQVGGSSGFGIVADYTQSASTTGTLYVSPSYVSTGVLFKLGAGSGNTNQLVLKGDGNVGIGTASPGSKLTIVPPAVNTESTIEFTSSDNAAISSYYNMTFAVNNSNTVAGRTINFAAGGKGYGNQVKTMMAIDADSGNVTIGSATTPGRLTVKYSSYSSAQSPLYVGNTGFTAWNRQSYDTFVLQQDDVTSFRMVEKNGETTASDQVLTFSIGDGVARIATSAQPLQFYVNGSPSGLAYQGLSGTPVLAMNTNGNAQFNYALGVTGLLTGSAYFNATSSSGYRLRNSTDTANVGGFTRRGLWEGNANYDPGMWAETGYGLYFYTNGSATTVLTLATTGAATFVSNVYATGSYVASASATAEIRLQGGGYGASYNTSLRSISGATGILQFGNNGGNYILAGNTLAGGLLEFRVNCASESISAGSKVLTLNANATAQFESTVSAGGDIIAYSSSDLRLKDNLIKIEKPLEKISSLNGYSFDWNDKQETYTGKDYGVIAQEVEEVLPEIVTTRDNGYKAVKYEKIVPLLIEAVKELVEKNKKLEQKNEEFETLLNSLINKQK
jgi:hypothetical protein